MLGNLDSYDSFCRQLANLAPCLVVSVAYHVAPEHRFPEPLEDCYAACLWARQHAAELGGISGPLALPETVRAEIWLPQ